MPGRVLGDLEPGPAIGRELDDVAVVLEQPLEEADRRGSSSMTRRCMGVRVRGAG